MLPLKIDCEEFQKGKVYIYTDEIVQNEIIYGGFLGIVCFLLCSHN